MDWPYAFNSHLYVIPRAVVIDGAGGLNSLRFNTRYGSVGVTGSTDPGGVVDAFFDGMNEKGLAANLLYLAENDFNVQGNLNNQLKPAAPIRFLAPKT
jgi:choloylglycine hydrolase